RQRGQSGPSLVGEWAFPDVVTRAWAASPVLVWKSRPIGLHAPVRAEIDVALADRIGLHPVRPRRRGSNDPAAAVSPPVSWGSVTLADESSCQLTMPVSLAQALLLQPHPPGAPPPPCPTATAFRR